MEEINKFNEIIKDKKILIIKKAYPYVVKNDDFEYVYVFTDEKNNNMEIEEIYRNQVYQGKEDNSLINIFLDESIEEINVCHIWKFEDFIFLSKEKYCECFDGFINYQVMENDDDLIPEYLINYATRYRKLSNKQEKLEDEGLFETEEYRKTEEDIQKLLINAQKRTYKETYKGERVVVILKK